MSKPTLHLIRHYAEMVVAMFVGMAVLWVPARLVLDIDAPALKLLGMGVTMTVPMVAWMRYRGHSWAASNEMAGAMLVPTAAVIALLGAELVEDLGALMAIEHTVMFTGMAAVMLLRREEYVSPAAVRPGS
jgi:hypothetical protein